MDKASIIGDAVSYMQELQSQAKKLKAEVSGLEASIAMSKTHQGSIENHKKIQFNENTSSICKKIVQVYIFDKNLIISSINYLNYLIKLCKIL